MKRFILFLIIVGVIGVGIFVLPAQKEETGPEQQIQPQTSETNNVVSFELSETIIRNIMKDALGARFNAQAATYKVVDLDHKGSPELIIGAREQNTATIQVLSIKNKEGEWERLGKIEYQEMLQGIPEIKELVDITGDGQDEIIVSLMYGGAASWTEGILRVDFVEKRVGWALMQKVEEGGDPGLRSAIFTIAASAAHQNTFQIKDMDNDGKKEIVEVFTQTILNKTECEVNVYEWNGALLAFDKALSEQTLKDLGKDCAM